MRECTVARVTGRVASRGAGPRGAVQNRRGYRSSQVQQQTGSKVAEGAGRNVVKTSRGRVQADGRNSQELAGLVNWNRYRQMVIRNHR